jgi:hypothetical protein
VRVDSVPDPVIEQPQRRDHPCDLLGLRGPDLHMDEVLGADGALKILLQP